MSTISKSSLDMFNEGRGKTIIAKVENKLDSLNNSLGEYGLTIKELPPPIQFSFQEIKALIKRIESNASDMDSHMDKVDTINRKAGIRRINEMQHLISKRLVNAHGPVSRELQLLKMKHAEDLRVQVSYRHQAMLKRLKIVRDWEQVLKRELDFLESCKGSLISKLITNVNEANDEALSDKVRQALRTMQVSKEVIDAIKSPKKDTSIANIDAIRTMVTDNLNKIGKIEDIIQEKKQFLQQLSQLIKEIQMNVPEEVQAEANSAPEELVVEETQDTTDAPKKGLSGMFSSFRRKN